MSLFPLTRSKRGGIFRAAIFLLLFIAALGILGWMLILPSAVQVEIEERTGFPVEVESLSCNPFGIDLQGKKMSIGNPKAFGGGDDMLELRGLSIQASLPALARGEVWIDQIDLDVSKLTLVIDERGALNLGSFLDQLLASKVREGDMPFQITKARLKLDTLQIINYSTPIPSKRDFSPMLDVVLSDLQRPIDLFEPVLRFAREVGNVAIP